MKMKKILSSTLAIGISVACLTGCSESEAESIKNINISSLTESVTDYSAENNGDSDSDSPATDESSIAENNDPSSYASDDERSMQEALENFIENAVNENWHWAYAEKYSDFWTSFDIAEGDYESQTEEEYERYDEYFNDALDLLEECEHYLQSEYDPLTISITEVVDIEYRGILGFAECYFTVNENNAEFLATLGKIENEWFVYYIDPVDRKADALAYANSNAKIVYSAVNACAERSYALGYPIPTGTYCIHIDTSADAEFDASLVQTDTERQLSISIGSWITNDYDDTIALIVIDNIGYPTSAAWASTTEDEIVGGYPRAANDSTVGGIWNYAN